MPYRLAIAVRYAALTRYRDDGGERAAAIFSLLGTAQLNGLNVEAYLRHVLERLSDHAVIRVVELLPWAIAAELPSLRMAA